MSRYRGGGDGLNPAREQRGRLFLLLSELFCVVLFLSGWMPRTPAWPCRDDPRLDQPAARNDTRQATDGRFGTFLCRLLGQRGFATKKSRSGLCTPNAAAMEQKRVELQPLHNRQRTCLADHAFFFLKVIFPPGLVLVFVVHGGRSAVACVPSSRTSRN